MKQTYTEEEYKKLLKNLFEEKSRVLELKKMLSSEGDELEEKPLLEKASEIDEHLAEKEKEIQALQEKLEKVKPAFQKLIAELKQTKAKIEALEKEKEESLSQAREEVSSILEEHKKKERLIAALEEEKKSFQNWKEDRERLKEREEKDWEEKRSLEDERQKIIEKLADSLTQIQKQNETIKELREEASTLNRELKNADQKQRRSEEEWKLEFSKAALEAKNLHQVIEDQLVLERKEKEVLKLNFSKLEEEKGALELKLQQAEKSLQNTHLCLTEDNSSKLERDLLQSQLAELERSKEEVLSQAYAELKRFSNRNAFLEEEKERSEEEIKKAHLYLAKKLKENTFLRDLFDRQKLKVAELQNALVHQKNERDNLQRALSLQTAHEEKMGILIREKTENLEALAKEWQEKYHALHKEWEKMKEEQIELHKMKKNREKLINALSTIKASFEMLPLLFSAEDEESLSKMENSSL